MLTGKQKSYLRGLANRERAIFQIGKDGVNSNLIDAIEEYLKAHELCKISLLKTCEYETREMALDLASLTSSEVVQIIGRTVVLYKYQKDGQIILPR